MTDVTREQLMRQIEESHKTMQELRKLFPGCFHADGRAIVASAHLPRLPAIRLCGECRGRNGHQSACNKCNGYGQVTE